MSGVSGLRKHGHTSVGDGGALGAASPTSLIIPGASSPAQTAEGDTVWDTDDDKLTVGTGAGRKTLVNEGGSLSLLGAPTADLSIGSHKLTNVTNPASAQDAATKAYVDAQVGAAGGLSDQGVVTYLDYTVAAAPANPSAGYLRHYAKTGGHMAQRDSSGTETLLDSAGGGGLDSGTSFPGSPADRDLYFRTDRDLLYFYDLANTQWLTLAEYPLTFSMEDAVVNRTATGETSNFTDGGWAPVPFAGLYSLWLTSFEASAWISATNNGSTYWTFSPRRLLVDDSDDGYLAAVDTSALTLSGAINYYTMRAAINDNLDTAAKMLAVQFIKTGSPGTIRHLACCLFYRLIG